eukprot:8176677-Pyramimonas_sp.AAC.1
MRHRRVLDPRGPLSAASPSQVAHGSQGNHRHCRGLSRGPGRRQIVPPRPRPAPLRASLGRPGPDGPLGVQAGSRAA